MIKFSNVKTYNFQDALRGMRNSWESWEKGDTVNHIYQTFKDLDIYNENNTEMVEIGPQDFALAKRLVLAGSDHGKFMRQILVSVDIEAPLYFFKQFDQYKVGAVTNSTSTMHRIDKEPITTDMFSVEDLDEFGTLTLQSYLNSLETIRKKFKETKDKKYWRMLIQMIPDSINQTRTTTLNYQVLRSIYHSRKNHRLSEWHDFAAWCETLPYSELITIKK